jgi:hypothetical protein
VDPIYFSIGGLVFAIGIFKRELLITRASFRLILGISVILFFVGMALHFTAAGRDSACGALLVPLLSLGLFRLCRRAFVRRFQREPKDTWLNWDDGLGPDKVFNIAYFVAAFWLWMLVTVLMLELAKAGW